MSQQTPLRSRPQLRVVTGRVIVAETKRLCCRGTKEKPCTKQICFRIDGEWYCYPHSEAFWNAGHDVSEHKVERFFPDDSNRR